MLMALARCNRVRSRRPLVNLLPGLLMAAVLMSGCLGSSSPAPTTTTTSSVPHFKHHQMELNGVGSATTRAVTIRHSWSLGAGTQCQRMTASSVVVSRVTPSGTGRVLTLVLTGVAVYKTHAHMSAGTYRFLIHSSRNCSWNISIQWDTPG